MLGTSRLFIGCIKWQHAVVLESAWEWDSINISFPLNGRDAPLLFWLALLYFSLLLGQIIPNFSPLFSLDKNTLSTTSIPQKYSKPIPNSVLATKSLQSRKNILSPIPFLTWKNSLFVPTNSVLLPPESKRCPLTLALALACADSVDELRFWNESES